MMYPGHCTPKCMLHDFHFYSHFYGEPFLTDNILWFCDGENARVVGYNMDLEPVSTSAFLDIAAYAMQQFRVKTITLETPKPVSVGNRLPSFHRDIIDRPRSYETEVLLPLSRYRETQHIRHDLRRAKKRGLRCQITDGQSVPMTVQQWLILKQHLLSFEPAPYYQAEFINAITFLLTDPATTLFEVFLEENLKGFSLARSVGSLVFLHFVATDEHEPGVSDIMYGAVIRHFLNTPATVISLGFTPTKGLYFYKRKWGNGVSLPGTYEIIWVKKSVTKVSNYLWISKLVKKIL